MAPKSKALPAAVQACRQECVRVIETSRLAKSFADECKLLGSFAKRLQPLLDDLEDNVLDSSAEAAAVKHLKDLQAAMARASACVSACVDMGPFFQLLQEAALLPGFTNAAIDMHSALDALDLAALKVEVQQAEGVALVRQQLERLATDYSRCSASAQHLAELRNEAEALRVGRVASGPGQPGPHSALTQQRLAQCSSAQLRHDVQFLRQQLAAAQQAREHVEAHFLAQLLAWELPLLGGAGAGAAERPGGHQPGGQAAPPSATPRPPPASVAESHSQDPVPLVQALLKKLGTGSLPVEQRTEALRPLLVAAGLEPGGAGDPALHSGAVLFALTDPDCARQVVQVVNEPRTEPVIRSWLLALVLSLAHPEHGLQAHTQAALMRTGLPLALCRLLASSTTPPEQRLQCLTMLRVMAHDKACHALLMEAKVLHAIVHQISTDQILVVKGKVLARPAATPPPRAPPQASGVKAGKGAAPAPGLDKGQSTGGGDAAAQNAELALLILSELAPGPYKAEVLQAGGVKALTACLTQPHTPGPLLALAARVLGRLGEDGVVALEAVKDGALVPLVALAGGSDPDCRTAARQALRHLLTPSPPSCPATAALLAAATTAPHGLALPPQGKQAKAAGQPAGSATGPGPGGGGGGGGAGSRPDLAGRRGVAIQPVSPGCDAGQGGASSQGGGAGAAQELAALMGRGMPPASASSLVALLSLGVEGAELPRLALDLMPRTTLDAACRAALAADPSGLALLLQHVGQGQAGALEVMQALTRDSRLKAQCGAALTQALHAARSSPQALTRLALLLAAVAGPGSGQERDKEALGAAAAFAAEVQRGQGVAAVLGLMRSQEPEARMAAVQALRPLLRYGTPQVQSEVLQADPLPPLVDVLKQPAADVQAVAEVMAQLASASPALLSAVVTSLAGLMASPSTLPPACTALLLLSGAVQGASGLMAQGGLVERLAAALASLPPASQLTPTRLLVALVQAAAAAADPAGQEGALRLSGALLQLLAGPDLAVRAAAAAGLGSMMRASAKTRQELSSGAAPGLLLDLLAALPPDSPQLPEVAAAVACLACLEGSCRPAVITRLRALLQGGQGGQGGQGVAAAQVCAHLSHTPKGRALVLSEQLVSGLVRLLTSGSPAAQCGAADALTHVASGGAVALPGVSAPVLPRAYVVERGAVEPLVKMLRAPDDGVVVEAALLLDCLSACEEGSRACRQAKAREALQEVLQRGKRGELGERAVKAAYAAYMQLL